jgi:hypothetical protein
MIKIKIKQNKKNNKKLLIGEEEGSKRNTFRSR